MANPLPEWVPLNWDLVSNPLNWMIVVLMVLIGTIFLCMVLGGLAHANRSQAS